MNIEQLIRMANQIGGFFEAIPDRQEALAGIAKHLKDFWDPRMRLELLAHFDAHYRVDETDSKPSLSKLGLTHLVVDAITQHRAALTPLGKARD
jgi:formate dehydrogenase subunit delta